MDRKTPSFLALLCHDGAFAPKKLNWKYSILQQGTTDCNIKRVSIEGVC